jgi:polyhydroxybutyrate depolymerase
MKVGIILVSLAGIECEAGGQSMSISFIRNMSVFSLLIFTCVYASAPVLGQSSRSGVWDANANSSGGSNANPQQNQGASRTGSTLPTSRTAYPQYGSKSYGRTASYQQDPSYRSRYPQAYSQRYPAAYPQGRASSGMPAQASSQAVPAKAAAATHTQNYKDAIASGGMRRTFTVHVPKSYDGSRPVPLVLAFHGLGMNGVAMEGLSLMDITAERNGFIVVYPDGVGARWNDGSARGSNGMDDVGFVSDLLNHLQRQYKIDPRHIHACGISNGGYFTQRLGCEMADRIASIGVISATITSAVCSSCHPRRSMPVVLFLGTEDPLVPREGESKELGKLGEALGIPGVGGAAISSTMAKVGGLYTANETAEFWARINNCGSHPREDRMSDRSPRDGCQVTRETYGGGSGGSEVVVYTVHGGGHNWPGGSGAVAQDVLGVTTYDISASDICWEFFRNHGR